jgi:molybdopterin molybdotransferase
VYESNSFALMAALKGLGITEVSLQRVDDDPLQITRLFHRALQQSNLVLLTGGVSTGDYDYVRQAAAGCGVQQVFYKVRQKPGKPLYFGMKDTTPVFGLPGNPASVLTCFYEFVVPALEALSGQKEIIKRTVLPLTEAVHKKPGFTHFLKGKIHAEGVQPLGAQESYRLSSFALADCLICLEEEKTDWRKGEPVEVHLLPRS